MKTVQPDALHVYVFVLEARQLGVGYFAFAPDEQTRQEQLKMLDDLRQQTMSQRERSQKVKEKRQAALKARLEKVKARKNLNLEGKLPLLCYVYVFG